MIIPRNHVVEKVINTAVNDEFKPLDELVYLLENHTMIIIVVKKNYINPPKKMRILKIHFVELLI